MCFSEPISYDRDKKFGTPKLSLIFKVFNSFSIENTEWWRGKDSNSRRLPSTDLQSAAFDRSATPPSRSSLTINRIFNEVNPILK